MKQIFDLDFKLNQEVFFRREDGTIDERPFVVVGIDLEIRLKKKSKARYTIAPKDYPEWSKTLYGWGKESIFRSREEAAAYKKDPDATDGWLEDDL